MENAFFLNNRVIFKMFKIVQKFALNRPMLLSNALFIGLDFSYEVKNLQPFSRGASNPLLGW